MRTRWLMALWALAQAWFLQVVVRPAGAGTLLAMSTLRIRHGVNLLRSKILQRGPPLIHFLVAAATLFFISIFPALRADPLALRAA